MDMYTHLLWLVVLNIPAGITLLFVWLLGYKLIYNMPSVPVLSLFLFMQYSDSTTRAVRI